MARHHDVRATVIQHGRGFHVLLWTTLLTVGAGLGWLLAQLPTWLSHVPLVAGWAMVEFLTSISGPILTVVLAVLGMVVGGVVALTVYDEIVTVEVTAREVTIAAPVTTSRYRRHDIGAVFAEGKDLVLLGTDTEELARVTHRHQAVALREAFGEHGYPWHDSDPYAARFQRWVDGMPGLDPHTNALLRARQVALDSDDGDDAAELRHLLAQRGVVVRDISSKQHWRPTRQSS